MKKGKEKMKKITLKKKEKALKIFSGYKLGNYQNEKSNRKLIL